MLFCEIHKETGRRLLTEGVFNDGLCEEIVLDLVNVVVEE